MTVSKSIVITGASSGFGAAFARALADDGHNLFICARRTDRLADVAGNRKNIFYAPCDVANESEVGKFFGQIANREKSIDVLIHCAGVLGPLGTFDSVETAEWFFTLKTNLFGTYLVIREAVRLMRSEQQPRIVVLSGGGAFDPMPCVSAYGASKAATVRLVETLAVELKPRNIAINAVAPGFAATEIHQATLAAGRERAGEHFDKTIDLMSKGSGSMDLAVDCIRYMISDGALKLSGKTISARFDPWGEPEFDLRIEEIMACPLYTTQRTNADLMPHSELARALSIAAERKRERREQIGVNKVFGYPQIGSVG
jgi:NAD(P)-dependent dehydrogenase (short-subunit alcohol dehydrogenase family)